VLVTCNLPVAGCSLTPRPCRLCFGRPQIKWEATTHYTGVTQRRCLTPRPTLPHVLSLLPLVDWQCVTMCDTMPAACPCYTVRSGGTCCRVNQAACNPIVAQSSRHAVSHTQHDGIKASYCVCGSENKTCACACQCVYGANQGPQPHTSDIHDWHPV
jgi:hypothetical protein